MAVELHLSKKTSSAIGQELGIGADLIRRWTHEFKSEGTGSFPGNGKQNLSKEQRDILELKKALNESRIEKDILKKAVSIFSRRNCKYTGS
jgi:transposase